MPTSLKIEATLKGKNVEIPNVLCEISLPLVHAGLVPILCRFDPRDTRPFQLGFEFSLVAEIKDITGRMQSEIRADKIYWHEHTTQKFSSNRGEAMLRAEAVDLRRTDFIANETSLEKGDSIWFWLTPSVLLMPSCSIRVATR
jgi:hypothetical protein